MVERVVAPVVPSTDSSWRPQPGRALRALPLAELVPGCVVPEWVYGMGRVDASGRVSDRSVVRALGWLPGDRLALSVADGVVVLRRDAAGVVTVAEKFYVVLPAVVRARCAIRAGTPVLLVADADVGAVLVYPVGLLDRVLAPVHAAVLGGERS